MTGDHPRGSRAVSRAGGLGRAAIALAWALVLASAAPAGALNLGEWVPGLTLSPFFSERMEYETNVFQTPARPRSAVISRSIPGLIGDYTVGPLVLSAGYRAEILRYLNLPSQDTEHHVAVGRVKLDLPRLEAALRDDFTITSDPPGSELTGRIRSSTNVLAPTAEYRLTERFSAGLNYAWTRTSFDVSGRREQAAPLEEDLSRLDRDEHLVGGTVFWKFRPRADLRLDVGWGVKAFAEAPERDVTRRVATIGLRGDITPRLASTFRVGVEDRQPERGPARGFTGLVLGGGWTWTPSERTKLSLDTERTAQESLFADAVYYVASQAALTVEQTLFTPKLQGTLRLAAGQNDYPTRTTVEDRSRFRSDMLLGAGLGATYAVQPWLRLGLEYTYSRRDSNFDAFDFENHKLSGRITVQF